jgi:hypothetical protein
MLAKKQTAIFHCFEMKKNVAPIKFIVSMKEKSTFSRLLKFPRNLLFFNTYHLQNINKHREYEKKAMANNIKP